MNEKLYCIVHTMPNGEVLVGFCCREYGSCHNKSLNCIRKDCKFAVTKTQLALLKLKNNTKTYKIMPAKFKDPSK